VEQKPVSSRPPEVLRPGVGIAEKRRGKKGTVFEKSSNRRREEGF